MVALILLLACNPEPATTTPAPKPAATAPAATVSSATGPADDDRRAALQQALDDGRQLSRLAIPGSGEGMRYRLSHQLAFPTPEAADSASLALTGLGLQTVEDGGEAGESWTVEAWEEVVLSRQGLAERRAELEALARGYGGEYEGWDAERLTPLTPPPAAPSP